MADENAAPVKPGRLALPKKAHRPPPPPVTHRAPAAAAAPPPPAPDGFDLLDALPPRPAAAPAAPFAPPRPLVKAETPATARVKVEQSKGVAAAAVAEARTPAPDAGSSGGAVPPPAGGRLEAVLRGLLETGLITPGDEQLGGGGGGGAGSSGGRANPFAAAAPGAAPFALPATRSARAAREEEADEDTGLPPAAAALLAPRERPAAVVPRPAAAPPQPSTSPPRPWWALLPDFVPVAALRSGFDPRDGRAVAIDYAGQAAAWAAGGARRGDASGSAARAGFWTTAPSGRKLYTDASGQQSSGRAAWAAATADKGRKRGSGGGRGRARRRRPKKRRK